MLINHITKSSIVFIILFTKVICFSYGQEPSHLFWGQKELAGVDIYSVFQDSKGIYWLTTNSGILKYDGRKFQTIPVIDSKSVSFFNLLEGDDGVIYCNNLSGQIYAIKNDIGKLYYQVADSLIKSAMSLVKDDQGSLIFNTRRLLRIDKERNVSFISGLYSVGEMYKSKDNELKFFDLEQKKLVTIKGDDVFEKIITTKLSGNYYMIYEFQNEVYFFERNNGVLRKLENDKLVDIDNFKGVENTASFFQFGIEVWARDVKNGIKVYDQDGNAKYDGRKLFENEFISAGFYDKEGNIILETFGSGLIFIPFNPTLSSLKKRSKDFPKTAVRVIFTPVKKVCKVTRGC